MLQARTKKKELDDKRLAITSALKHSLFRPQHQNRHVVLYQEAYRIIDRLFPGTAYQSLRMHEKRRLAVLPMEVQASQYHQLAQEALKQARNAAFKDSAGFITEAEKNVLLARQAYNSLMQHTHLYSDKQRAEFKKQSEACKTSLIEFHYSELLRAFNVWIRPERLAQGILNLLRSFSLFIEVNGKGAFQQVEALLQKRFSKLSLLSLLLLHYKFKSSKMVSLYEACAWYQTDSRKPFTLFTLIHSCREWVRSALKRRGFNISAFPKVPYDKVEQISRRNLKIIQSACEFNVDPLVQGLDQKYQALDRSMESMS